MIKIINYLNEAYEKDFEPIIEQSLEEARTLLPRLPRVIQIYFSDYGVLEYCGVGGFAYASDILTISLDPNFPDIKKQKDSIRPTIFHEAFHLSQNFTAETGPFSGIENALYEGMATVFEREHTGVFEQFGDYRNTPIETLQKWCNELKKLDSETFSREDVYSKWKFYHPELKERWIVYRTGTWLVDQILARHRLSILDLEAKTASEVLALLTAK